MTLILCLDKRGGMLFNNRRQTIDYEVVERICRDGGEKLYISPFSEKYFEKTKANLLPAPLNDAPDDAVVFIEDADALPFIEKIHKIIIYRWNKVYPSDKFSNINPLELGFRAMGKIKFSTDVHEDTVKEVYKR